MFKFADTMTMSHLLNENLESNGLKYLAEHILGVPKEEIQSYEEASNKDFYTFARYAMNDAIWTYQLYQRFMPDIIKQGLSHLLWDIEMPFQKVLTELHINGIKADVNAARQMTIEVQHLYYQVENELLEMFGGSYEVGITKRGRETWCKPSINFNSSKQVIPLIESLGFEIYEKAKKGGKSFGKRAKKRLEGKHPFIDLLIKFGKIQKLLSGFLIPFARFVEYDNRVRCSFNNTVAVTGRLSCSSPNIEQLPKKNNIANIRNLFITESCNMFIVADYKGQELRILGEESKDRNLRTDLKAGVDLHQVAADSMNISRTDAKPVSFGIPYGKRAYGFARDWNCTEELAQERIDKYFNRYQSIKIRMERCNQQIYRKGYVVNLSGRKRRFPNFHKLNKWQKERCYRQGFNFIIQSYGADVVKVASPNIIKDIKLKIVNLVHDEIVVECPKDYVGQGIKWMTKCMVEALPIFMPWEVTISVGNRYGEIEVD